MNSNVLKTLPITDEKVIFAAKVAMKYKIPFEEISTKMLARCLKFLIKRKRNWRGLPNGGDLLAQFWALVNNNSMMSSRERLAGTPFVNIHWDLHWEFLKGFASFDDCLHLACSGAHVR